MRHTHTHHGSNRPAPRVAARSPGGSRRSAKSDTPAALETLRADHVNFQKLLRVFETELNLFHDAERCNYGIMRDIMHYVTNYPDRVHHPTEELVFERLLRLEAAARRPVEQLQEEHHWLTAAGTELLHLLDEILADAMISRDSVESLAREYLKRLRAHMDAEETTVFPMAAERLSADDWAAIAADIRDLSDPLFGAAPADQAYRAIRERLAAPDLAV